MKLFSDFQKYFQLAIKIMEIITYTIVFIIITVSIFSSLYIYVTQYGFPINAYIDTRIKLGEAVSLSLAFILGVELLKLFFVKSYNQLLVIICLVAIKLTVGYFLSKEIDGYIKDKKIKNTD